MKFWLDGQLTHDYRDVTYIDSAHQHGFFGRSWAPIYGGGCSGVKSRNDYLWIDHLYISGKRK